MRKELIVPVIDGEEEEFYADTIVVDAYGLDLYVNGETFSASLEGVDRTDIAIAVLSDPDEGDEVYSPWTKDEFIEWLGELDTERIGEPVTSEIALNVAQDFLHLAKSLKEQGR